MSQYPQIIETIDDWIELMAGDAELPQLTAQALIVQAMVIAAEEGAPNVQLIAAVNEWVTAHNNEQVNEVLYQMALAIKAMLEAG